MSDKIITLKQKDTGDRLFPKTVKESIIDLEIDQEYNAESTNAQSGTAVAEAIEDAITELPDVNNGLLTIQKNGTTVNTFTANASTDVTCNITVPTDTNDLTNNAGFITSSALTPYELKDKTVNVLSTSGTIALTDNSINTITPSGNITFTLPTVTDNTVFHQILVQINMSTVYTIDLGLGATPHYFNNTAPDLSNVGVYNLYYEYDKANQYWVCGEIAKGAE